MVSNIKRGTAVFIAMMLICTEVAFANTSDSAQ